jgi:hypothetical protein
MHDSSSLSVMMKNFHEDVTEFNDNVAEIERWPLWWRCKERPGRRAAGGAAALADPAHAMLRLTPHGEEW